jgi:hypothetical protein
MVHSFRKDNTLMSPLTVGTGDSLTEVVLQLIVP